MLIVGAVQLIQIYIRHDRSKRFEFWSDDTKAMARPLKIYLRRKVYEEYSGSPILVWVLLNIIVPVVIRLVIEWWLNRRKEM